MMISHHKKRDKGNGLDRVSEYTLTHERHRHHKFNLWLLPEPDDVSHEDYRCESRIAISWTTTIS